MQEANKGIIDLTDRVLKELLKKPGFKEGVRTVLQNIDPESSRRLVRTILWQDPEFYAYSAIFLHPCLLIRQQD